MPSSPRTKFPYPDENSAPWASAFLSMVLAIDASLYSIREDRNILIMGGGAMTWNATSGVLTWAADIELFASVTGYLWKVQGPGTVTIQDGQAIYITVSRAPQSSFSYALQVGSTTPNEPRGDDCILIGLRRGSRVHFRDGYVIQDAEPINVFDSGGGVQRAGDLLGTGSTDGVPKVGAVTGLNGVLPVAATEIDCNGDTKCKPTSVIGHFATANNTQATAYTSPHLTAGTWKVNVALVADENNAVDGGTWDFSFALKATGVGTAAFLGTIPGNVSPDNGTAALKGTIDVVADTFRLRVTGDAILPTDFGYVIQVIPVIQ